MADDDKQDKEVGRRDTLKLASALGALGLGLGVMLEAGDAEAAPLRVLTTRLGKLSIKLYKFNTENKSSALVQTFDLSSAVERLQRGGTFSIKLFNEKGEATEVVFENELELVKSGG